MLPYIALAAALALALVALEAWRRDRAQARTLAATAADRQRLLGELLSAEAEERKRIASDIHDDSIQALGAALLRLKLVEERLDDPDQRAAVAAARETTRAAMGRLRHLIFTLTPPTLEEEGLVAALRAWGTEARSAWGAEMVVAGELDAEPPPELSALVYRITVEAATNAAKHAQGKRIDVTLGTRDGGVAVGVRDDGAGFVPGDTAPGHLGLRSMRERAESAGGWWRLHSAPGAGTTVEFWIPV